MGFRKNTEDLEAKTNDAIIRLSDAIPIVGAMKYFYRNVAQHVFPQPESDPIESLKIMGDPVQVATNTLLLTVYNATLITTGYLVVSNLNG